jgi:hypothetical protein
VANERATRYELAETTGRVPPILPAHCVVVNEPATYFALSVELGLLISPASAVFVAETVTHKTAATALPSDSCWDCHVASAVVAVTCVAVAHAWTQVAIAAVHAAMAKNKILADDESLKHHKYPHSRQHNRDDDRATDENDCGNKTSDANNNLIPHNQPAPDGPKPYPRRSRRDA